MYRLIRVVALGAAAFCFTVWGTRAAMVQGPGAVIEAPTEWVPFAAELRMTMNGELMHTGKVWQDGNGSFRSETSPSGKPEIRYIVIRNHVANRFYKSLDGGQSWTSHPMDLRPNEGRPLLRRVVPGSFERLTATYEGFEVYGDARASLQTLMAPALNFFVVKSQNTGGWTNSIQNVQIGPQPPDLFEPPSGATVREFTEKAGFRITSKGNAQAVEGGRAPEAK